MRLTPGMAMLGFALLSLALGGVVGFASTFFTETAQPLDVPEPLTTKARSSKLIRLDA